MKKTTKKGTAETVEKKRAKFELRMEGKNDVYVAGTFNNWDPGKNKLRYNKGVYSASILMPKGTYEYKFVINGDWCVDPECLEWTPNEHGSLNSIRRVE